MKESVEEEILEKIRERARALIGRDDQAIDKLLSERFIYTNSSGKQFNKRQYLETYVLSPTVTWRSQSLTADQVSVMGEIAVVVGKVHDVAKFADFELDATFCTTQIYRRRCLEWEYLAGHTSALSE